MTLLDKLNETLEYLEYAKSEVDSGINQLPDDVNNESSRAYMNQSESYLTDVWDKLTDIIEVIDKGGDLTHLRVDKFGEDWA